MSFFMCKPYFRGLFLCPVLGGNDEPHRKNSVLLLDEKYNADLPFIGDRFFTYVSGVSAYIYCAAFY